MCLGEYQSSAICFKGRVNLLICSSYLVFVMDNKNRLGECKILMDDWFVTVNV